MSIKYSTRTLALIALYFCATIEAAINNNNNPYNNNFNNNNNNFNPQQPQFQNYFPTAAPFPTYTPTTYKPPINNNNFIITDKNHEHKHPINDNKNYVIDRYNHRYPDGSYEYRFELADGTARYERGYFLLYDKVKSLVVVGYYAYRMPDGRYITVFYNADRNGYRQNQSITPQSYPNLPRSIDVPQARDASLEPISTQTQARTPNTNAGLTTTKSTTTAFPTQATTAPSYRGAARGGDGGSRGNYF